MSHVLQFEFLLKSAQLNVLMEGARKIYHGPHGARGRRVGQGCIRQSGRISFKRDVMVTRVLLGCLASRLW
jgi:hypothetical protein